MGLEQFVISDTNPNEAIGGGGCACHPQGQKDCTAPYVVFHAVETEDPFSPVIVIGHECFEAAAKAIKSGKRVASRHEVTGTAVEISDDEPDV